jgi:prolyl-tRNA synthetase
MEIASSGRASHRKDINNEEDKMAEEKLTTRAEDFSEWYNQLVLRSDLADYSPVRGCMVVKPYGWTLWENITAALDKEFKATGHPSFFL